MAGALYRFKKLPDTLFKVRVPAIATYSDEELKRSGILPTRIWASSEPSGSEILAEIESLSPLAQEVVVMIRIEKMLEIYQKGYPIYVISDKDVVTIYEVLEDYYSGSGAHTDDTMNVTRYYDERIPIVDRFLTEIFKQHKVQIQTSKIQERSNSILTGKGFRGYKDFGNMKTTSTFRSVPTLDPRKAEPTGAMSGYKVGYMEMQNNAPTKHLEPPVPIETKARVLEGNYVNKYEVEIDYSQLQKAKRPGKPKIDLEQYRQ